MRRENKVKVKPFIYSVILMIFIFQDALQKWIPAIKYMDELFALFFLLFFFKKIIEKKTDKTDVKILLCVLSVLVIGAIGTFRSHLDIPAISKYHDAFNIVKFTFVILGAPYYFQQQKNLDYICRYLSNGIKFTVVVSSIFMLVNFFLDIGMHTDYRYGMRAYNFVFSRVGGFYSACILWLIILVSDGFNRKKQNILYIGLTLINMCATLRSRSFAFVLMFVMLYYYYFMKKKKKFKWQYVIPFILLAYFIAQDQIGFYFSGDRARNILVKYGIETARTFFPFGSGFASYGTAVARDIYSPLYLQYGFNNFWGLSSNFGDFLTDNYWPAIVGELGVLGLIVNILLLIIISKKLYRSAFGRHSKLIVLFALGTLYVSSLASNAFLSCTQLMVFVCFLVQKDCDLEKRIIQDDISGEYNKLSVSQTGKLNNKQG